MSATGSMKVMIMILTASFLQLNVLLKKEASGKHEVLFAHDICDFCDELGNKEGNYHKYLQYIGIPESCPFDAVSMFTFEKKSLFLIVTVTKHCDL